MVSSAQNLIDILTGHTKSHRVVTIQHIHTARYDTAYPFKNQKMCYKEYRLITVLLLCVI